MVNKNVTRSWSGERIERKPRWGSPLRSAAHFWTIAWILTAPVSEQIAPFPGTRWNVHYPVTYNYHPDPETVQGRSHRSMDLHGKTPRFLLEKKYWIWIEFLIKLFPLQNRNALNESWDISNIEGLDLIILLVGQGHMIKITALLFNKNIVRSRC